MCKKFKNHSELTFYINTLYLDINCALLDRSAPKVKVSKILGVERLYIYRGDGLDLGGDKPDIIVKSTVSMERMP